MALLPMLIIAGRAPNSDRRIGAFSIACQLQGDGPVLHVGKLVLVGTFFACVGTVPNRNCSDIPTTFEDF
jgi:hypothetical protein